MFCGLGFLVDGHMAVAASSQGGLLARVDHAVGVKLLAKPQVQPMEMRGREMSGWLRVDARPSGPNASSAPGWIAASATPGPSHRNRSPHPGG